MLVHLILFQSSLRLTSVLFILFTLFCSSSNYFHHFIFQFIDPFFCFRYSAIDSFYSIFNFSNPFVSVCLFFNSPGSLLIDTCIFSIVLARILIIFTIIFWILFQVVCLFPLQLFGILCFLIGHHLCNTPLPFNFFFFNLLCLRSPFPRLQGWIISSFWFLPSEVWSSGLSKLPTGEICTECFLFFPLMVRAEWGGNPVCWWLALYFCLVCCLNEASCTGCYWWLCDTGSCTQLVSFVWVLTIWHSLGLVLW